MMRSSPCLIGFQRMRDSMQADPENIDNGSKFSKVFNSCFQNRAQKVVLMKLNWNGLFFLFFVYYAHEHVDRSSLKRKIYFCTFIGDTNVRHLLDQLGLLRWSIIYFTYILYILDIYFIYISHAFCKHILCHFNITKTNLPSVSYQ